MTISRERPPLVADERTQLVGWLDMQRALVRWKLEGLAEADEHRAVRPASPLMTPAGLKATLRWMLIHVVEETARHVGHLDTMRELLDGSKGYY